MKIIHLVLGKANPNRMNGVNKVAFQLASEQTALGYDVTLWGIANSLEKNYPDRNFKTTLFLQLKNKLILNPDLVKAIKALNQDVIFHIHGAFIPEFYHISRLLKRKGIAYIYTPHGSLTEMAMSKNRIVKKIYFQLFESRLIRDAKRVQLLGVNEFNFLDTLTKKAKKCLIANGQDLEQIPLHVVKKTNNESIVFGFCGRLALFHKGLDLMLKGFHQYKMKGGNGSLEFIGDGKDREHLMNMVRNLGIEDAVVFHGKKFGQEKFSLLAGMDVFLHTSRMEGFPTAVLEAAAMKIPTITSEATNINDYVREYQSGLTLSENSPDEIALFMWNAERLFRAGKLNKMGSAGRAMVEKEFDWKNIAQNLVDVYAA